MRRSSREGTCAYRPRSWRAARTSSSAEGTRTAEPRCEMGCPNESAMPEPSEVIGAGCLARSILAAVSYVTPPERLRGPVHAESDRIDWDRRRWRPEGLLIIRVRIN